MSLLLDALKRAEQAKQEAGEQPAPEPEILNIETPSEAPAEPAAPPPLITRDRLPDISQSLEILTDDISPPPLLRTPKEAPRGAVNEPAASAQAQARRLFEAKEKPGNPKTPFYVTLGTLGLIALAGAAYVWYQTQPRSAAITAQAPTSTMPSAAQTQAASPPITQPAPSPTHMPVEMIVPPLLSKAPSIKAPSRPETSSAAAPRYSNSGPSLTKTTVPGLSLNEQAYIAFERGDMATARGKYEAALTQDPHSRDAMLGLAALDAREGNYQSAEARYLKVLEVDPRNPNAQAAMTALRGQSDPVAQESHLKNLLAQQPGAAVLHFALGNVYAGQNRWSEAQQEYFKAYVAAPGNADFAFNLAVSLEHLRQNKPAADYYRKALDLHAARPGSFDPLQAQSRLRALGAP